MSITLNVAGTPAQMGSKKAFIRGGRAIITDDNSSKRRTWANAVTAAAAEAMQGREPFTGPLLLIVSFAFVRPASHFGSGKNATKLKASAPTIHAQSPDLDKLIRCVGDALNGVVYRDDRQIAEIKACRGWTQGSAGARIEVRELF